MQTITQAKFFAKRYAPGLGGQEGVRAAFDDEITIIKSNAVGSDFAAPATTGILPASSNVTFASGAFC